MPVQIPKHYKETSISKPNAIGEGIEGASKTATNYITADATGIKIHMSGNSTTYQHQSATATTYYVQGSQVASFGSTITIGGESDANIYIDGDSIDMRDGSDTLLTIEADVPADTYYDKESVIKIGGTDPVSVQMYTNSANDSRKAAISSGFTAEVDVVHTDAADDYGSYRGYDFVRLYGDGIVLNGSDYADMGQAAKCLNIQSGRSSVGTVNAGSYKDVSITFPAYYDAAPIVVVGFATTSVDGSFGKCCVAVYSTSATGFVARVYNGDDWARSPSITWIAMP